MSSYRKSPLAIEAPNAVETITRWSGQTMGGRVPAFMALAQRTGGLYYENPPSLAEGLRATGLDAEVRLERTFAHVDQSAYDPETGEEVTVTAPIDMPDYRTTVLHYNDGRQPVPVTPWVSPKYQVVQTTEALAAGQQIIQEGWGLLAALGAWGKPLGSKVYATFALDGMLVGGGDPHGLFLTITTSHDGMGCLGFRLVPMRFACTNEEPMYFGPKSRRVTPAFTRRHTKNVLREAATQAREALELSAEYREVFTAEAEKALAIKVTENEAITYWRQVFGVPTDASDWSPRQARVAQDREDQLVSILNSEECDFGRRTAYGSFQAVTSYLDHFRPVRGQGEAAQTIRRQESIVTGELDKTKQHAWELALAN